MFICLRPYHIWLEIERLEEMRKSGFVGEKLKIIEVTENKKQYLNLLLLADEQEDMIDRYIDKGRM